MEPGVVGCEWGFLGRKRGCTSSFLPSKDFEETAEKQLGGYSSGHSFWAQPALSQNLCPKGGGVRHITHSI